MKRIAIAATILSLNLATMSAAAQGAAGLGRVTEREPGDGLVIQVEPGNLPVEIGFSDDLDLQGVELDPELLRALADLRRNREMLDDPIFSPDYTRTRYSYSTASYSSGAGGRLALRLIPLGIGLIVLIVRAGRKNA